MKVTLLVTGTGGPLGQSILKAIRQSTISCRVLGVDRNKFSVGTQWADEGFVLPDCSDREGYLAGLGEICAAECPQLIIPGSDSELRLLSQNAPALMSEFGVKVVASPPEVLAIALSKWETVRFLEQSGLNFPRTARMEDEDEVEALINQVGFPLIAKPVNGAGSQHLFKVGSRREIVFIKSMKREMILQEYLQPDDEEYTVAVYTLKNGETAGAISMKRELAAGITYRAWVSQNPIVNEHAIAVVKALRPFGPCNVQLRLTARGPVTFEINPRFSSTTSIRAHFGYNEVEMAIRDLVFNEPVSAPSVRRGAALRFWEEAYLDGDDLMPEEKKTTVQKSKTNSA